MGSLTFFVRAGSASGTQSVANPATSHGSKTKLIRGCRRPAPPEIRFPLLLLSLAIAFASVLGCSNGRLKTYPAKGKVSFKTGSPVHVGTVELKSREHGVQARGAIDKDGNFTLTTYVDGDGAVAGIHDCVVVQFVMTEEMKDFKPSAVGVVHPRFASYSTSGLSVEISADQPNDLKIEVEGVKKISANDEAKHDEKQHRK